MKAEPRSYYGLDIIPENDAERVWLGQFLEGVPEKYRPLLSSFFRIDLEDMCVDENGDKMTDRDIEEVVDEGRVCALVERISIQSAGYYVEKEMKKRSKYLKY